MPTFENWVFKIQTLNMSPVSVLTLPLVGVGHEVGVRIFRSVLKVAVFLEQGVVDFNECE